MAAPEYILRKVVVEDMQLLFDWANDNETRENAITTNKISFKEHVVWFRKKLNAADCAFFILERKGEPVGQIRFDYNKLEEAWEIDYSVAKEYREIGIGKIVLTKGINSLNHSPLLAYVKANNLRSESLFNSLGFTNMGICTRHNTALIKFYKELITLL